MTERKTRSKLGVVLILLTILSLVLSVMAFFGINYAFRRILFGSVYKKEAIIAAEKRQLNDLIQYLNQNRASITNEDAVRKWIRGKKDLMIAVYDPANPYSPGNNEATLYSSVRDALSMYNLLQDEYADYWYSSAVASRGDRIRSRVVKVMYFPMYRASMYGMYASGAIAFLLFAAILYTCIRKKTRYICLLSRELRRCGFPERYLPALPQRS